MKLINTDGLAIIGPGSEWFWTAISGVVLAVTFIAIYRQLRLQASAGAIEQATALENDWRTESMSRSRLAVQLALRDGVDPANVPTHAAAAISNFWERVGYLVRQGHIGRDMVLEYLGNDVRVWWALLLPNTEATRSLMGDRRIGEHFEWLDKLMTAMELKRAGWVNTYDDAYFARILPNLIEVNKGAIRTAEELRAITVRPPSTATLMPEVSGI